MNGLAPPHALSYHLRAKENYGFPFLYVLRLKYSGRAESMPLLLLYWTLASSVHQQSCYWQYGKISRYPRQGRIPSKVPVMMTSSTGNISRVTGLLCEEFTAQRCIPRTKASDAELWCFFIYARINGWVNIGEAGDLRRHRTHYDIFVMELYRCRKMNERNINVTLLLSKSFQHPFKGWIENSYCGSFTKKCFCSYMHMQW